MVTVRNRKTKTTVSLINYHFVFCPRYRRKIFDILICCNRTRYDESIKEIDIVPKDSMGFSHGSFRKVRPTRSNKVELVKYRYNQYKSTFSSGIYRSKFDWPE